MIPILKPVAKASLKSVKKVAKDQGVQALKDIVGGENVKKSFKTKRKNSFEIYWSVYYKSVGYKFNSKTQKASVSI